MPRIVDEDRHRDEIGELATHAIERPIDESEAGADLSLEIVRDRFSVEIGESRLPGKPNDFATVRDHGRRERARFLKIRAFEMSYSSVCCHWLKAPVCCVAAASRLHQVCRISGAS